MRIQSFYRTMLVSALTLLLFVLVAALLVTARPVGATPVDGPAMVRDTSGSPRSPAAVAQALLPRSTAAYNGLMTPATQVYAPWLVGGTSVLRVLNTGAAPASVRATFSYTDTGALIALPPGAVGEIQTSEVPTGTKFSAIVTATQPVVAIVNDFGSDGSYATSYAAVPASLGQTYLVFPDILYRAPGGWDSTPVIQNVGEVAASVTVVYTKTGLPLTTTNWVDESIQDLAPGESFILDPSHAELPEKFEGVASVRANEPMIAVVHNAAYELGAVFPRLAYIYRVPLPDTTSGRDRSLYFPVLVNAFEAWNNSEIQILNAGSTRKNFTLVIDDITTGSQIDAWRARTYPQNLAGGQSPPGQPVAGRVENAGALHSVVWLNGHGNFTGDFLAAYSTPSVGGKTWYLPYTDQGDRFATFVAVQNLSDDTADITLTYHSVTGPSGTFMDTINGSDMALYSGGNGLPFDFVGGVVVEADQPVAVITLIAGRAVLDKEVFLPITMRNYPFN